MFAEFDRPAHHNVVNPFIVVDGAAAFIDFLCAVFEGVEHEQVRTPDRNGDGTLIHAEVAIGSSVVMLADRKPDWPFTPALTQVYVADADAVLDRAAERGATVVTPVSSFYGGVDISRFVDPWHNVWWLFSPARQAEEGADDWRSSAPRQVYTSILETMRNLRDPRDQH